MGQPISQSMCCSTRDKDPFGRASLVGQSGSNSNWARAEGRLDLERPQFLSLGPLWDTGYTSSGSGSHTASAPRRLAVAGDQTVCVYRMCDMDAVSDSVVACESLGQGLNLNLEYSLELPAPLEISALVVHCDRRGGMSIIVAAGPVEGVPGPHFVRAWRPTSSEETAFDQIMDDGGPLRALQWSWDEGYAGPAEPHQSKVTHLMANSACLLVGEASGRCFSFEMRDSKGRASRQGTGGNSTGTGSFALIAEERLHEEASAGGLADLAMDKCFVYSAGRKDLEVSIWSMPDLRPIMTIAVRLPQESLQHINAGATGSGVTVTARRPARLAEITGLRRPISRWSGAKAAGGAPPRGVLFVSALLGQDADCDFQGAGVLMVWALGTDPVCKSVQIAHESKIAAMAYGPYDNGPLVTADVNGIFRVWDFTPRLWPLQHVDTRSAELRAPAIVVDPMNRALYSVVGAPRLFIWLPHGGPRSPRRSTSSSRPTSREREGVRETQSQRSQPS